MVRLARRWICLMACVGLMPIPASAAPISDPPIVLNASQSARAGDIVGFQGENFGTEPVAFLDGAAGAEPIALERVNTFGGIWASFRVPANASGALVVRIGNGPTMGAPVKLNAAVTHHLDAMQIATQGKFRIFGRNLLLPGSVPTVMLNDSPVALDLAASNEHMLVATAPLQWDQRALAQISVDNGNGTGPSALDRPIAYQAGGGKDPFLLGVGWADAFDKIAAKAQQVKCNGITDDTRAIQEAVDGANKAGGGIVQLPAGNCRLEGSVALKSRVVLQGAGKDKTSIAYSGNYPLIGRKVYLAGLRDFTLVNKVPGIESALLQNSDRVFLKNVGFELNGGIQMFLTGNSNFVVDHCDFTQPKNLRDSGPFVISTSSGLVFTHNRIIFANGSPSFGRVHDAYIAENHITRDVRDNQLSKGIIHSLTLDFAYRVAVVKNIFDVSGGPVKNKTRNDGETILTEGGGGNRTENIGYVKSATLLTLTDTAVKHNVRPFAPTDIPENYSLTIVGGKGAGQSRRVLAYADGTFMLDHAWDIVPDTTSRYTTFVWGLEKSLIKGNVLSQNSRGIWLYQTAVRDVDVVSNTITEGGGIYLRAAQNLKDHLFTPMVGVRIAQNTISNSGGEWPSYVHLAFVRMDASDFGFGSMGIEVRENTLHANTPNISLTKEESGAAEGFIARSYFEGPAQGLERNQPRLLGTIFQNNQCIGCNVGVIVREGAQGTVQDANANSASDATAPQVKP